MCIDKLVADKSCFCFPLRIGSIIIAILCIAMALGVVIINSDSSKCYPGLDIKIASIFSILSHVALLLAAIYFIYGVIKKDSKAVSLFLVALLLVMITTLAEAIIWFFTKNSNPTTCPKTYIFSGALLMRLFIFSYFLITVNSYRVYYLSENRDEIIQESQHRTENINKTLHETIEKKLDDISEKK
ncbi:unnamed protein product [Arctia plantaginis]|uniref:Uncharacterized protein n=1 Tax=Arctia plantaginis TaxID=874455 RepID=A0A8S1AVL0_ARCPL|nr:unnamed protein product [Arctia plantaginis]CAB3250659.1 unnamed protein product [Arctia plantaginis]